MSSQDFRHASPSASAKDAEMKLLAFPSFPSLPLWLQDCPLHVNSLPSICTSGFPVFWECQRPQLSKSSGYGVIQICTWRFQKWIKEISFFPSSKCLWRYLHFIFFSFSAQRAKSFCTYGQGPGSWGEALDGARGHPTEHTAGASPGAGGLLLLACLSWWKENEASEVWDWK